MTKLTPITESADKKEDANNNKGAEQLSKVSIAAMEALKSGKGIHPFLSEFMDKYAKEHIPTGDPKKVPTKNLRLEY